MANLFSPDWSFARLLQSGGLKILPARKKKSLKTDFESQFTRHLFKLIYLERNMACDLQSSPVEATRILPQKVVRYELKTCSCGCVVYDVEFLARNLQF